MNKAKYPKPTAQETPLSLILRRRRAELGLTLQQIADELDVEESTVQRWESGVIKAVRYDKLIPLARLLHVPAVDLVGGKIPPLPERGPPPSEEDGDTEFLDRVQRLILAAARLHPQQREFLLRLLEGAVYGVLPASPREKPRYPAPQETAATATPTDTDSNPL